MKHTYSLQGATCTSCKEKIETSLNSIPEIESAKVNDGLDQVEVVMSKHVELSVLQQKLKQDHQGKYTIAESVAKEKANFLPLILVVSYVVLGTFLAMYLTGRWEVNFAMSIFMGLFFLGFSFFKLLDVKGFAYSYMSYDILASKSVYWGFAYPFVEFALGILYFLNLYPLQVNIVTAVLMFIGLIGVLKSVLKKSKIKCACLGTGFNLPMTFVTVVEDAVMMLMALYMVWQLV
jgi:cation transport ATPase